MYCDLIDDDELIQNGRPSTRVGQAYLIFSICSTTQTTRTRGFGERKSVAQLGLCLERVESYQYDDVYSLLQVDWSMSEPINS